MHFHQNWIHYRGIKGTCHVCGQETHAGMSLKTGEYYWLHDGYKGIPDFYRSHGFKNLERLDEDEFEKLMTEAKAKGVDPMPRPERGVSKPVRCVETGMVFASIQDAADHIGVQRASLSAAIKRGGTSGGYHWKLKK